MLYYLYVSNVGLPEAGLVAGSDIVWESLYTGENATDKSGSAPAIVEIGGGWYSFDITLGTSPWDVVTEDLLGTIDCDTDGDVSLSDVDRYKPVCISLRGLGFAKLIHKAVQSKTSGDVTIYATDGSTAELKLDMTDVTASITRNPTGP